MKKMILSIILVILIAMVVILSVLKFSGIGERILSDNQVNNTDADIDDTSYENLNNLFDNINESYFYAIYNSARSSAIWYDEAVEADKLVQNPNEQKLSGITINNNWVCIGGLLNNQSPTENPEYGGKTLGEMIGLNATDVNLNTTNVYNGDESSITSDTCSSIRVTDNGTEVLLVAIKGGIYNPEMASVVYALSSAENGEIK